jgi:BASS family bile acid:Na+ symporter
MSAVLLIKWLTGTALFALLLAAGLRLTWGEIVTSVRRSQLALILLVNFILIPVLTVGASWWLKLPVPTAIAMTLLAAAPFAPMVPTLAHLARADLALAAGLTALFPVLSALLTPFIVAVSLNAFDNSLGLRFDFTVMLGILLGTVIVPLGLGLVTRARSQSLADKILRPTEIGSQIIGVLALGLVVVSQFKTVIGLGWKAALTMLALTELSLQLGYTFGGNTRESRRSLALGASCRNLALAVFLAASSFADSPVAGAVMANGLLFIVLALVHVAWWRLHTK